MMGHDGTSLISYVILTGAYGVCSRETEMAADTVVLTVCIPVALQQQLDTVAQAMERSRAWVITQARALCRGTDGRLQKSTRHWPRPM